MATIGDLKPPIGFGRGVSSSTRMEAMGYIVIAWWNQGCIHFKKKIRKKSKFCLRHNLRTEAVRSGMGYCSSPLLLWMRYLNLFIVLAFLTMVCSRQDPHKGALQHPSLCMKSQVQFIQTMPYSNIPSTQTNAFHRNQFMCLGTGN